MAAVVYGSIRGKIRNDEVRHNIVRCKNCCEVQEHFECYFLSSMDEVNIFTILAVYRDVYVVSSVFCYETTCKRIEVRESCRE